ncbi:MAG TPA: hypothetical protein VIX63_13025 [Vicinamibacterales bacterium]
MQMIWHEAVRKICNIEFLRRTQKVTFDQIDVVNTGEQRLPLASAKREEIPMEPDIVKAGEMFRIGMHVEVIGNARAFPAEAGSCVLLPAKAGSHTRS